MEYKEENDSRFPSFSELTEDDGGFKFESGASGEHGSEAGIVWVLDRVSFSSATADPLSNFLYMLPS